MSAAMMLLALAGAGQLALAPAEKYNMAKLLEAGFELKAASGEALFLQGRLGAGKPTIIVKCMGQTFAVSVEPTCQRVY